MQIELHGAFAWDCPDCDAENFERAEEGDLDEDQAAEVAENLDIHFETADGVRHDDDRSTEYLVTRVQIAPSFVKCKACGRMFPAILPHMEEEEDD